MKGVITMTTEEKINFDKSCKELASNMVDNVDNYNQVQKDILKFLLEIYHENRKSSIIKCDKQAEMLEKLMKGNN